MLKFLILWFFQRSTSLHLSSNQIARTVPYYVTCKFNILIGNFIDTANVYHGGKSEEWLGELIKKRGNREELVSIKCNFKNAVQKSY